MAYSVRHWWGKEESELPETEFLSVLREVERADDEHPTVALKHESEWLLSYDASGRLVYENVERGSPQHLESVSIELAAELWVALARGNFARINAEPWLPGY